MSKTAIEYAKLSRQKRDLEAKMEVSKKKAINEVMGSKYFDRGAPFIETKYGVLICATKAKITLDPISQAKVNELKAKIKQIEQKSVADGKAEIETSQYLSLR